MGRGDVLPFASPKASPTYNWLVFLAREAVDLKLALPSRLASSFFSFLRGPGSMIGFGLAADNLTTPTLIPPVPARREMDACTYVWLFWHLNASGGLGG